MNFSNSSIGSLRDPFSSFESVSLDANSKESSPSTIGGNYKAPGMFSGIATAFTATFKSLLGFSRKETSLKNGSSLMQSTKQREGGFSLRNLLGKMTLSFSKKESGNTRDSFDQRGWGDRIIEEQARSGAARIRNLDGVDFHTG